MTEVGAERRFDVVNFQLALEASWRVIPTHTEEPNWASRVVVDTGLSGTTVTMLEEQLERLAARMRGLGDATMTAAVWIPRPETGYVSGVLAFRLIDLGPADTADSVLASFAAERAAAAAGEPGDTPEVGGDQGRLVAEDWRGDFPAGAFVATHELIVHRSETDLEGSLEERTVFAVFPANARQLVQFVFSAESIGAYDDMPAQTQAVVTTLQVQLGAPL